MRIKKCHICKESIIDNLITDKKHYHKDCYNAFLQNEIVKQNEKKQKDELYEYLLQVHNLSNYKEIPKLFYMKIEEIRNDSGLLGKVDKKYKQGVKYSIIKYTYQFCKNKITYVLKSQKFKSKLDEMQYVLGIVRNHFMDAYNHHKRLKDVSNTNVNPQEQLLIQQLHQELTYRNKAKHDISEFL